MEKVINLSFFLDENTPNYGGVEGTVTIEASRSISLGHTSNNSHLSFPNHINTHIDFPRHFSNEGKTINDYDPAFWIFQSVGFVKGPIESLPELINGLPETIELLIIKTGFGALRGKPEYWAQQPVISADYAALLKKKFPALRVFGFDCLSLTSQLNKLEGKKAHIEFLLEHDILVVEDMNLSELNETPANVIIAPLLVNNADGALCTIFALS